MKVLLVEDEQALGEAIRIGLKEEAIALDYADNGHEGLIQARRGSYDVIILDVMLPGKNGYEVCQALRRDKITTPILMLTARQGEADEAHALNIGADDFLTKPFSYRVLIARLRALVRRGATPFQSSLLQVGDIELDLTMRTCLRTGSPIELTNREFTILELFMHRPGQVFSKQRILDQVWGFDFEGDANIVEVYIKYLRRKIDEPFGRQTIQTVRGAGYRLAREAL